jgi:hypothetical protein
MHKSDHKKARRVYKDSTEMNLQEVGLDDMEWIKLDWILTSDGAL